MDQKWKVLFYVPNLIGYVRFLLLTLAWFYIDFPKFFLPLYVTNVLFDGLDGYAARKLNQVSNFGAWLDVVVDAIGRGIVWCHVNKFGYAVPAWEWIVFCANHARAFTGQWRESFNNAPLIVQNIMKNGFKTYLGTLVITGIHLLPVWLYVEMNFTAIPQLVSSVVFWTLLIGRLFGFVAEAWCVYIHVYHLINSTSSRTD